MEETKKQKQTKPKNLGSGFNWRAKDGETWNLDLFNVLRTGGQSHPTGSMEGQRQTILFGPEL